MRKYAYLRGLWHNSQREVNELQKQTLEYVEDKHCGLCSK